MSWIRRLKEKWNITSWWRFVVVMIVFALTGSTVMLIREPLFSTFSEGGDHPLWLIISYYVLILPIYNVILLCYGFLLGEFSFFWEFEKKMLSRLGIKK